MWLGIYIEYIQCTRAKGLYMAVAMLPGICCYTSNQTAPLPLCWWCVPQTHYIISCGKTKYYYISIFAYSSFTVQPLTILYVSCNPPTLCHYYCVGNAAWLKTHNCFVSSFIITTFSANQNTI